MHEWLKVAFLVPLHLILAPAAGLLIRTSRNSQRMVFFVMMILTVYNYGLISMSPWFPDPFYKGHTRGFECTLMEVMAIILVFANIGVPLRIRGPWLAPGLLLWLIYCFASLLSIFNSVDVSYTLMAFVKFTKAGIVYLAAFQFFRSEEDIHFFLKAAAIALIVQALLCLKQRYFDHIHQVFGWFEHQNSMVMYTYMLALPLLAAALTPLRRGQTILYLSGVVSGLLATVLSLSRGGIGAFTAGAAVLVLMTLWDQVTTRRLAIISVMGLLGLIVFAKAAHTLVERFTEPATESSNESRHILNQMSRDMLFDYPLFGTGWNTYGLMVLPPYKYGNRLYDWEVSKGFRMDPNRTEERGISESWYYLILAETGFVGAGACFIFIFTTLFWCTRAAFRYRRTFIGAIAMGLFAGIGMNYLQSNLERVLTQEKNLVAWMICLGLIARMEWWRRQGRSAASLKTPEPAFNPRTIDIRPPHA